MGKEEESPEKRDMERAVAESSDFRTDLTGVVLDKGTPPATATKTPDAEEKSKPKEELKTTATKADAEDQPAAGESSGAEITPENLLKVIAQEWKLELERLRSKYMSGYRQKKDARSKCLVQSGHAEIEGDTMLFIYGNALEVLTNQEFQKTVEQISFQYVRFDSIVDYSNLSKLKRFQRLSKLSFSNNFLHSFVQLAKLECLPHLASLTIEHNDLMRTTLFRSFIYYRFTHVTCINGVTVTEVEKQWMRRLFQHFDRLLSAPPFFNVLNCFIFHRRSRRYQTRRRRGTRRSV